MPLLRVRLDASPMTLWYKIFWCSLGATRCTEYFDRVTTLDYTLEKESTQILPSDKWHMTVTQYLMGHSPT